MEEKEFSPEGTSRSAMPAHRASVVKHWLGYFSPPEAGFFCAVAASRSLSDAHIAWRIATPPQRKIIPVK
jgi:hypothetical protein